MKRRRQPSPKNIIKASSYRKDPQGVEPRVPEEVSQAVALQPKGIFPDVSNFEVTQLTYGSRVVIDSSRSYDCVMESINPESKTPVVSHEKKHRTIVVMSGKGFLLKDGTRTVLEPGSTHVLGPSTPHCLETDKSPMTVMYCQGYKYDESAAEAVVAPEAPTSKAAKQAVLLAARRKAHKESVAN